MEKKEKYLIQSSERSMPQLPLDVITGILSKLPVKSLLQFRWVSKSWYSLISSSHFNQSIIKPNIQRQNIVMVNLCPQAGLYTASLGSADNDTLTAVKIDHVLGYFEVKHHVWTVMIGSCNGLLCFLAEGVIYIFNPTTRECKKVPDPKFGLEVYGFGYDCIVDDYKVVLGRKNNLHLYSLRSDSWKKIQDFPRSHHHKLCGAPLNGAIHWFCLDEDCTAPSVIFAFGFADEKFWEIGAPTFPTSVIQDFEVGVFGGCLGILRRRNSGHDLWLMKEYRVKQSWTGVGINVPFEKYMKPLALLKEDEALLRVDCKRLVLYNIREGTYRDLVIRGIPDPTWIFTAMTYVKSLISPIMKV